MSNVYGTARYGRDGDTYQDGFASVVAAVSVLGGSHSFSVVTPPGATVIPETKADVTVSPGVHTFVVTQTLAHEVAAVTVLANNVTLLYQTPVTSIIPHGRGTISSSGGNHTFVAATNLNHAIVDVAFSPGSHAMAAGNNGYALAGTVADVPVSGKDHTFIVTQVYASQVTDFSITGGSHSFTVGRKKGEGLNGRSIGDLIQKVDY